VTSYEELGVPVRSVNWVRTHAGVSPDGQDRVWATMGQQADGFFVLDIDKRTFTTVSGELPGRPLDHGLQQGSDALYGFTDSVL
jgi:hypothetical protein